MPHPRHRTIRLAMWPIALWLLAVPALAQLAEHNVLVVYDSTVPDSVAVAEHYAGSHNVPGGVGGLPGARPGVYTVDLAALPDGGAVDAHSISQASFNLHYRDPLRVHLLASGLVEQVRCIVLTKGIPHRVQDSDSPNIGDAPGGSGTEFNNRDLNCAALDAELVLLWQDLSAGEAGGPGDSHSDGMIINPYHKRTASIVGFDTRYILDPKTLIAAPGTATGQIWQNPTPPQFFDPDELLSPGDIYLVCRLDGNTVADVLAMIDRSIAPVIIPAAHALILDESGSEGVPDMNGEDGELDNDPAPNNLEDDYEVARDFAVADGRFPAERRHYDPNSGAANFLVGPLIDLGGGMVIEEPVVLLATYGGNHSGRPGSAGITGQTYAESFNYAPGAVFNTVESFNGRALRGLGTLFNQEQAADFIGAGGSFAIGHVWEPFTISIPDNRYILSNFHLGPLAWAEAAYASIPQLSWHQIVLGDPLARLTRASDDLDADGDVDIADLYAWHEAPSDVNNSGAPDDADRDLIESSIRGSEHSTLHSGRR